MEMATKFLLSQSEDETMRGMLKLCFLPTAFAASRGRIHRLAQNRRLISGATAGMCRPHHPHESARFTPMVPEKGDLWSKVVKLRHQCRRYREYAGLMRTTSIAICTFQLILYTKYTIILVQATLTGLPRAKPAGAPWLVDAHLQPANLLPSMRSTSVSRSQISFPCSNLRLGL